MANAKTTKPKKPARSLIVQPNVRVYTTWTPAMLRAAEVTADMGQLRLAANLCDWVLSDDRVQGCMHTRMQALLGLDPTFEQSGDKRKSKRVVRALEAGEDWWDSYPESELALMLTWGAMLGIAPAAHNWTVSEENDGRVLPKPEFWHPQNLRQDPQTRAWMMRVATGNGFSPGSEVEVVAGDGLWILHTPYGKHRPASLGLWRGLARLVLLKYYALIDYGMLGQEAKRTVVTADKDTKTSKEQRQELASQIRLLGRDGVIVLPPGFDYKLVELSAGTKDVYDRQIELANTSIAIAIRGGNLSTEVKGGSLAATESQAETGDAAKLRFDAQSLTSTIHDQSLVWWASYNFGDRGLAPWPVYPVEPKKDLKSRAEVLNIASTALDRMLTNGLPVDPVAFAEEFEIVLEKQADGSWAIGAQYYQYDLEYGVATKNDVRKRKGLPPTADGNVRLVPASAIAQMEQAQFDAKAAEKAAKAAKPPAPSGDDAGDNGDDGADPNADDAEGDPSGDPPPTPPKANRKATNRRHRAAATKGTDNGLDYTDAVGDKLCKHAAKELAPTIAAMLAAVANADDFASAKKLIVEKYKGLASPRELALLTDAAMTMTQLGGHLAVREDIPELED